MQPLTDPQKQLFDWLVDYIDRHQYAPSIRQMMQAMDLKSPAPVQSRLDHLRKKGYIDWKDGQARTIRILQHPNGKSGQFEGIPLMGAIAAGGLIEPYADSVERLDLGSLFNQPQYFALRVTGDSMIEELITEGDIVVMQPVNDPSSLKNGTIVAALVEGEGTTLKRFFRQGRQVTLQPGNPKYDPIKVTASKVRVQGKLVGVWRDYSFN